MAKKPVAWMKVYNAQNEYRASFVELSEAAAFVAILGAGATVRNGHSLKNAIWREGEEEFSAAESYDRAGDLMHSRSHWTA